MQIANSTYGRIMSILMSFLVFAPGDVAHAQQGVTWEEMPGNPLLPPGNCLSWRCAGVTDPTLVIDPDGTISTWFTTIGIRIAFGEFVADGPYFGRSSGPVTGMAFSPEAAVVPTGAPGTWDRYVETPTVRRNADSTLTMWYMGHPAFGIFDDTAIGQMVSTDAQGTNWIRPASPIYKPAPGAWDSWLVTGPTVARDSNGIWYLYYTGAGPTGVEGIGLLTSSNGIDWTPFGTGPVLPSQPGAWDGEILEQCVLYYKDQFWMWYSAYQGPLDLATTRISIGLATSPDGIKWTRYSANPVITPGLAGSWNDLRVLAPDVAIQPDGSLLMAAYGVSRADVVAGIIGFWRSRP